MRLFIGGIRSGKSKNAEEMILQNSTSKPIYLATNEFFDEEMLTRVAHHKAQRQDKFVTIEEPLNLLKVLQETEQAVLIECVSMWINNMLYHKKSEAQMLEQLQEIMCLDKDLYFVINDVSCSLVSENRLAREFVDINCRLSQFLASTCKEVYHTVAGISVQIK